MVILDAIASVNKSNQYYFSNSGHHQSNAQPSSSSYKNNVGVAPRHYPGKAVDVSLSLEPSNAMGALYEANWVNAHQAMMTKKPQQQQQPPTLMTSVNGGKSSPPSTQPPSTALRRQPQPECHSPPHLRNKPSPPLSLKHGNSGRESSSSSSSSATTNTPPHNNAPNNRLSSLGQYQVTLDQIRRLEEKDANITKTICELNGFKPTPLRRRQRQLYPDWDEHNSRNRKMAEEEEEENEEMSNSQRGQKINFAQRQEQLQREGEEEEEEVVRRSDLVSQFLKLKNNKKFPKPENNNNWNQESASESYGNNKLVNDDNDKNREKYRDNNGTLPLRNSMRGFCGSAIDLKEMFRRKKDAELSPKMNNKVSVSNGGRKIYPKTINLTKNLVRDPVILDPSTQPTFLAEKHRYHHRSHPNLQSNYDEEEVFQRERDAEARRNMKFNQRNCDSSSPTSNTTVDHDYEVIDYQDVVLREKPVKRSNTTVSRAKSVRINPVADLIVDSGGAQPRNGFSKWKNNRSSMPVTVDTGNKYNTVTPSVAAAAAVNGQQHSPPHTSGAGKSSAVRRSKSINPSSFLDNWNRRQREESEVKPPPPATGSSLRHQQSLRQQPIRPKLVHLSPSISQSPSPNHQVDKRRESPNREVNNNNNNSDDQDQFIIPRPRLIVPVHTYARKRRTGNLRAAEEEEEASQNSGAKDAGKTIR